MFLLIILFYVIIGLLEIIPMIKRGERKETVVYCIFLSLSFILSLLLSLGVEIPSPAKSLEKVIDSIIGR